MSITSDRGREAGLVPDMALFVLLGFTHALDFPSLTMTLFLLLRSGMFTLSYCILKMCNFIFTLLDFQVRDCFQNQNKHYTFNCVLNC